MSAIKQEQAEVSCDLCGLHELVIDPDTDAMIGLIVLTQKHRQEEPGHTPRLTVISVKPEPRTMFALSKENI